jgi:hypothetical protein
MDGMKQRAKQLGIKFPYVIDATSDVARAFGATRTPEAFLFDAEGKLVYHGTIDDSPKDATAGEGRLAQGRVDAVSTGKTVTTAETKAMGCSIKFRRQDDELGIPPPAMCAPRPLRARRPLSRGRRLA